MTIERLLNASRDIWDSYHVHPFVQGIKDGTLDKEKFKFYMVQDYLYLIQYTKVFAVGIEKADDLRIMQYFAKYIDQILNGEMAIQRSYLNRLGVSNEEVEQAQMSLDNHSYTSYMLNAAATGGAAEVCAAILSCAISYEEIGKRILQEAPESVNHPFYGEWCAGYSGDEYAKGNEVRVEMFEELTKDCNEAQLQKLETIFVNCSRYEKVFWDMAWEMRP